MNIILEKRTKENFPFIKNLFFEFKKEELGLDKLPWQQLRQLLEFQFKAHEKIYPHDNNTEDKVILFDTIPVGRFILSVSETNIHISEMIILKDYRRMGIGSNIIKDVISRGKKENKPVSLRVFKTNTAIQFYKKIGFKIVTEDELNYTMEFVPSN